MEKHKQISGFISYRKIRDVQGYGAKLNIIYHTNLFFHIHLLPSHQNHKNMYNRNTNSTLQLPATKVIIFENKKAVWP